ncbi:hypothetical protein BX070DRAFT_49520 [Coemansia spiralis]|nr:hypothetical protein BX070DRAFT_49520 [Coemansia spiralis]
MPPLYIARSNIVDLVYLPKHVSMLVVKGAMTMQNTHKGENEKILDSIVRAADFKHANSRHLGIDVQHVELLDIANYASNENAQVFKHCCHKKKHHHHNHNHRHHHHDKHRQAKQFKELHHGRNRFVGYSYQPLLPYGSIYSNAIQQVPASSVADFAATELVCLALSFALSLLFLFIGYKIGNRVCKYEITRSQQCRGRGHSSSLARRHFYQPDACSNREHSHQCTVESGIPNEQDNESESTTLLFQISEPCAVKTSKYY